MKVVLKSVKIKKVPAHDWPSIDFFQAPFKGKATSVFWSLSFAELFGCIVARYRTLHGPEPSCGPVCRPLV